MTGYSGYPKAVGDLVYSINRQTGFEYSIDVATGLACCVVVWVDYKVDTYADATLWR